MDMKKFRLKLAGNQFIASKNFVKTKISYRLPINKKQ